MSCDSEVAVVSPASPATTYEWLCTIPMATSAGSAVSSLYETSKNYNSVTQYALGTVETSVKKAASTVAPVVHKLDGPIQAVDSYAASKLVMLGDKVPSLKCEPGEVTNYLSESKESLATRITDGRTAVSTRLTEGKEAVTGTLYSGKEALYSKISAGSEAVANSRAGVLVSEGKQAITTRFVQGKEALGSGVAAGYNAVYSRIQSGAEHLANTRAGVMVGVGVDRVIDASEGLVDYVIPEMENEKELFSELEKEEKRMAGLPLTRQPKDKEMAASDDPEQEEEGEGKVEETECEVGRVEHVYKISRKMRLRMYYRSMQRLQAMQQNCQATLHQLKDTVDLLKLAHAARDGLDRQYQTVTSALKDLEDQIKQLLSRQAATGEGGASWLPKDGEEKEEDNRIEWLNPRPRGTLQASLDYAKQLSGKVFHSFQSVTVATTYLPKQLKDNAGQAYQYAQEMYSTLKPIQTPMDLSASALNKISSVLETQLGYVTQLGTYLSSVLQRRVTIEDSPEEDAGGENDGDEPAESESVGKAESDEN